MPDRAMLKIVLALVAAQVVLVAAFVLPAHDPRPHDVPVALVGPPQAAARLEAMRPGALDVRPVPSEAAARAQIADREVYGALVGEDRLLVATAAAPAVAQLLAAGAGEGRRVVETAPLDTDDPRGATLNLMFLPLIILCIPAALLVGGRSRTAAGAAGGLAALSALGGLAVIGLVGPGIGALPGPYLALAGVAALIIAAVALPAAAAVRLLGPAGVGVAAVLFLLVGNPASGNASAPELLPGFWRAVGPWLPPGAGGSALRGTAYFDGGAVGAPLAILGAWIVTGLALLALGARRRRRAGPLSAPAAT